MAIFRTRALDAANKTSAVDTPLLLPRPHHKRLRGNWQQLKDILLPNRTGRISATQEQRQNAPNECGAVCLAIILGHHGCHIPLSHLRRSCGVSRDGSDGGNLLRAANLFGMEAKGFKKGIKALEEIELPAILFWNFNHFVVLDGIGDGHYWINDPASGRRCVQTEELDRYYTGIVLTFQPRERFERNAPPPSALKLLRQRLKTSRRGLLIALLFCAAATCAWLAALPFAFGHLINWMLQALFVALAAPPISQALSRQLERRGSEELQRQLLEMPSPVLDQHFSAELSGCQRLLSQLMRFLDAHCWSNLPLLLAAMFWGFFLFTRQPVLALALWASAAVFWVAVLSTERIQRKRDAQSRISAQKPISLLQGGFYDPETLKAQALEHHLFRHWAGLEAIAVRERQRLVYTQALQEWIPKLAGWSMPTLLLCVGLSLDTTMALPLVLMALGLAFAQWRSYDTLQHWPDIAASIRTLHHIAEEPTDPLLIPQPLQLALVNPAGSATSLEFESVSFGYVPVKPPLITNLDLQIDPGQRVAIVGSSASGKSTVAKLMAGLLQPSGGVVKLNGQPLMEWPRTDRLRAIAMVQESMPLLECSVRENLSFWDNSISESDLEEACQAASILERIRMLPQGFDTMLYEANIQLSGGEQQQLQIAQALLQRPSLLILDEATASLDARAEQQVQWALSQLSCTQVVVAQRLSTIRNADEILVLEQGQIVQRGKHSAMARKTGSPYENLLKQENHHL